MPSPIPEISGFIGQYFRVLGFIVAGLALGRFFLDQFKSVVWQVQIALALGMFGLLIALTRFSTAGSAGGFALGLGAAYFVSMMPARSEGGGTKGK